MQACAVDSVAGADLTFRNFIPPHRCLYGRYRPAEPIISQLFFRLGNLRMDPLYWSLILIAAGLIVIILELFIPSAGILGVIAGICLVSGIVIGFIDSIQTGLLVLLAVLIILPVMFSLMIKAWPHTPIGRRILIGPVERDDVIPKGEYYDEIQALVGQLGVARTKMLPSGIVMINGKKFDAISEGLPLDQGATIKVIAVKGNRIVVAQYDGEITDTNDLPARDSDMLSRPLEELGLDPLDDPLS